MADGASCLRLAIDLRRAARLIEAAGLWSETQPTSPTQPMPPTLPMSPSSPISSGTPVPTGVDHAAVLAALLHRLAFVVHDLATALRSDVGRLAERDRLIGPAHRQLAHTRAARSRLRAASRRLSEEARHLATTIHAQPRPAAP